MLETQCKCNVKDYVNLMHPTTWCSRQKNVNERDFGSSKYKTRKSLQIETVVTVHSFYEGNEVNRARPSIKDCAMIIQSNGNKSKNSKRLITCKFKEAYKHFKGNFPSTKIGFFKFGELRLKHCILALVRVAHILRNA